jgi:hypothetical protein
MSHPFPFRKVYGPAIAISVITIYGLLLALLGDGIWDELSWVALTIPLAVLVWKCWGGSGSLSSNIEGGRR